MIKRFRFVSPGEVLVGVVITHDGRPINSIKRLQSKQAEAIEIGTDEYSKFPVYCDFTPGNPGTPDLVDLRNPELKIFELVGSSEPVLKIGKILFKDEEEDAA